MSAPKAKFNDDQLKEDQCKVLWKAFEANKQSKKGKQKFYLSPDDRGKLKIEYIEFQ